MSKVKVELFLVFFICAHLRSYIPKYESDICILDSFDAMVRGLLTLKMVAYTNLIQNLLLFGTCGFQSVVLAAFYNG